MNRSPRYLRLLTALFFCTLVISCGGGSSSNTTNNGNNNTNGGSPALVWDQGNWDEKQWQ